MKILLNAFAMVSEPDKYDTQGWDVRNYSGTFGLITYFGGSGNCSLMTDCLSAYPKPLCSLT